MKNSGKRLKRRDRVCREKKKKEKRAGKKDIIVTESELVRAATTRSELVQGYDFDITGDGNFLIHG